MPGSAASRTNRAGSKLRLLDHDRFTVPENAMLTQAIARRSASDLASEVYEGLTKAEQKELPSKYLYDEVGSALFEVICALPEYGLHRAGTRLLARYADEIVDRLDLPVLVAELGSGSG